MTTPKMFIRNYLLLTVECLKNSIILFIDYKNVLNTTS